jgi:HAE1 family hydrophobic/amphiphilic exporter-1
MTVLVTVAAVLFGVLAFRSLPVNDLPAVDYPVIQAFVGYPGASPQTMANNVATPLERQFMQIPGIEIVTSRSSQGFCMLTLQFALTKSIDAAATDVQSAISRAAANLPLDLPSPPTFSKTNPNDQPIQFIALTSDSVSRGQLYDYANTQVGQRISIVPGVSQVQVFGSKAAIRVKVDPEALAIRGISFDELVESIQASTKYSGAGQFDGSDQTLLLQPHIQLDTAEQYDELILGYREGAPVYLKDVARTVDSVQDERLEMRFWARGAEVPKSTVVVAVSRQAGANVVEVAKAIRDLLPIVSAELPASVRLTLIHDRSATIVNSVTDVEETLFIAFGLVVIVIFVFLGRASDTLIPVVAMPLSLLLTFIAMQALGYSLDNLSLMALTLAIGFLVDDAIVFLENTVRRMERGEGPLDAAVGSAREISFTILSMTVSLAAVFLPFVLMPGLMGRIFREFSVTIIISILASGIVSLTLTPLMCSRILGARGEGSKKTWMERAFGAVEKRVLRVYGTSLTWFLRRRWVSALTWVGCLAGTVVIFGALPKSFLPLGDSGFIWGVMIAQDKSSPEVMRRYHDQADEVLHADPNVRVTFTMTGNSQYLTLNQGMLLAFLTPVKERPSIHAAIQELSGKLMAVPGILPFFRAMPVLQISAGVTQQGQGQYAYALSGIDAREVYAVSDRLVAKLREFEGFATLSTDHFENTPNLDIDIRRQEAASHGVSIARVEQLLRTAYSQHYLYLVKKPEDQYQVIVEVEDSKRRGADDLTRLRVRSDDGKTLVPLSALVSWKESLGPQAVNHINQFTSVTVFFNLKLGVAIGDATDFIEKAAREIVPPTIRSSLQGEAETFRQTVDALVVLMLLAVFVMYVILGILYESYLHPLTVLSSLPVALVGGLATLWLCNEEASLYAYIGMFMLMGIVKKNGIMIVDFALQRIGQGATAEDAIHEASLDRFRPILMTTLAAFAGAVPIALGYGADGESRRPLGLVIVGGLLVSQLITLYITPVIYLYLEDFQEKILDRTSFFRSSRAH